MILWSGSVLLLAALIWPLLLCAMTALPALRQKAVRVLPVAPVPALWLAMAGGNGVTVSPDLLLGVTLDLDEARRLLLGMTAGLWCVAGLAAQPMAGKPHTAMFAGFWCLVLAGNLGVFLALDIVTFYVAFAAVSLASWFLIIHERTEKARHAARVYIVIALVGEVALLLGLIIGAHAAQSMDIAEVRAALGASETQATGIVLLIVGLGIKAGLVPLHVWLPLAHPAAPVPGSAVLSGAIVKAGLFGLIVLVPETAFGSTLMGLGLVGAFGAALWGLTQANPKAVLAYSTISQMGLMITMVGAGGPARETVPYFALHHGLAKGALFLLVGVMMAAGSRAQHMATVALAAVVSASVAGFPLTGGALAKAAVKEGLTDWTALALSLSSVATALVLIWFLARLRDIPRHDESGSWGFQGSLPMVLALAALVFPWLLWRDWAGHALEYALKPETLREAIWPIVLALPLAAAVLRWPLPRTLPGDLLLFLGSWRTRGIAMPHPDPPRAGGRATCRAMRERAAELESSMVRWRLTGISLPLLVVLIFVLVR